MNEEQAVSKVDGILLNQGIEKESDLCVLNLIRWVAFFLWRRQILKYFCIYNHLGSSFSWTPLWMSYSYTATTKCSPSMDPERALWSLRDHHLLPEAEACVRQHLPDLYVTAAVSEEAVGNFWGKWHIFLIGRKASWWLSLAEGYFRFILKIFL